MLFLVVSFKVIEMKKTSRGEDNTCLFSDEMDVKNTYVREGCNILCEVYHFLTK